jgi:hypothetical protein
MDCVIDFFNNEATTNFETICTRTVLQALKNRYPSRGNIPLSQERILPSPPSLHGLLFFYLLALGHGSAAGPDRSRGSAAGPDRSRGSAAGQHRSRGSTAGQERSRESAAGPDRSRGSAAGPDRSKRTAAGQNALHQSRHHSTPDTAADMVSFFL